MCKTRNFNKKMIKLFIICLKRKPFLVEIPMFIFYIQNHCEIEKFSYVKDI